MQVNALREAAPAPADNLHLADELPNAGQNDPELGS